MKKSSVLIIAAALILSSCSALTQIASSDNGHRFQDGIYNNTPAFRSKEEKIESQAETQALAQKTRESQIYLFGDKKDTVAIPQDMSAIIRYDQKLGGTVVTVGENPYDWRFDLENNYGYYYGPYSLGSSWYWSRHYSPFYALDFAPWRYRGWYDGWYYGGWYSPYYYGGFYGGWYDPWYWGSHWGWYDPWYSPYYCGWYGGWDPYWGHHHHHGHGPGHISSSPGIKQNRHYGMRANTDGSNPRVSRSSGSSSVGKSAVTVRRGIGTSSSVSRSSSTSRSSSVSRATSGRSSAPVYKRPASSGRPESTKGSYNSSSDNNRKSSESGYSRDSYNRNSSSSGSSYSRGSSSSGGGYSRGGSGFSGGSSSRGGYSRGSSSGGHRR